jgi:threonine dehydrogenase-like Zn-dependent dehydrogenase
VFRSCGEQASSDLNAANVTTGFSCQFCREGLQTSCPRGGMGGTSGADGGQGEAVRVPYASGTLAKLPVGEDSALLPSLLTLSDVFCTGHHCAVSAGVDERTTVTVIGDGAVGLSAVLAAKRLGAERMCRAKTRNSACDLGFCDWSCGSPVFVDRVAEDAVAVDRDVERVTAAGSWLGGRCSRLCCG